MSIGLNSVQEPCTGPELQVGEVYGVRGFWVDDMGRLLPVTYKNRGDRKPWIPQSEGENVARCVPFAEHAIEANRLHTAAGQTVTDESNDLPNSLSKYGVKSVVLPAPSPLVGCVCGIYGYFDADATLGDMSLSDKISPGTGVYALGVIAAYGRCLIGSRGFRAEKARVVSVSMDASRRFWRNEKGLIDAIAKNYEVPVYRTRGEMIQKHPLTERPRTPDRDPRFWEEI